MVNKSYTDDSPRYYVGKHVAVSVERMPDHATAPGKLRQLTGQGVPEEHYDKEVMDWGAKNDLPQQREALLTGNNIIGALMRRSRDIYLGQGWYAYEEKYIDDGQGQMRRDRDEVPMPDEVVAWFEQFDDVAKVVLGELVKHELAFVECIRDVDGNIISRQPLQTKYMRAEKKDPRGKITHWWWSNDWTKGKNVKAEDKVYERIPVYDPTVKQAKFLIVLRDDIFDDGYYPVPSYWGARKWIDLANIIPEFHIANIQNGAAPRFHLVIPHDFFGDYTAMNDEPDEEKRKKLLTEFQAREQAFVDDVEKTLSGIESSGRMIVSKSQFIESLGARYDRRIHIEPIAYDLRDEALIKLYGASLTAVSSAMGIHPVLASIDSGKGIGSGTEIRNAYLLHLITAAPGYRKMLDIVWKLHQRELQWPEGIHYAIRDAEMTTLSENPSGVQAAETPIGNG